MLRGGVEQCDVGLSSSFEKRVRVFSNFLDHSGMK